MLTIEQKACAVVMRNFFADWGSKEPHEAYVDFMTAKEGVPDDMSVHITYELDDLACLQDIIENFKNDIVETFK